jgi:hypothetical protein
MSCLGGHNYENILIVKQNRWLSLNNWYHSCNWYWMIILYLRKLFLGRFDECRGKASFIWRVCLSSVQRVIVFHGRISYKPICSVFSLVVWWLREWSYSALSEIRQILTKLRMLQFSWFEAAKNRGIWLWNSLTQWESIQLLWTKLQCCAYQSFSVLWIWIDPTKDRLSFPLLSSKSL